MEIASQTSSGVDKTKRYGWITKDEPGVLKMLHKDDLKIHPSYQRDITQEKVKEITAAWSWLSLGALVVGERNGEYWLIDGMHRATSAKRRSDITYLPCVVFQTADVKAEARAFLDLNTGRKPVTAVAKQKAMVAAEDATAIFVQKACSELGLTIRPSASKAGEIKCVAWCVKRASEDASSFLQVLGLAAEISAADNIHVAERLLEGLWFINAKCEGGITSQRIAKRLREKGARALIDSANRASAYYARGGGMIWAQGMLAELNKGLRIKFTMSGVEA